MRETIADLLRRYSDTAPSRQTDWRKLRGAVWLEHAMWRSGLDSKAFAERFIQRGRSESNLMLKWKTGVTAPSRSSAISLERLLPGTQVMFDLPLYELLADRPLPASFIESVLNSLRREVEYGWEWIFPGSSTRSCFSNLPGDSQGLVATGDIWGLIAIVALVRQAELTGDALLHIELCKDMYRALPAVLKQPWIAPSFELLSNCLNQVRARLPLSQAMFDVDWSVIAKHECDPAYEPDYELRAVDPVTRCVIEFEDPILEARLIRGYDVKKQETSQRRRSERKKIASTNKRVLPRLISSINQS